MRILHLSDTHNCHRFPAADIIVDVLMELDIRLKEEGMKCVVVEMNKELGIPLLVEIEVNITNKILNENV